MKHLSHVFVIIALAMVSTVSLCRLSSANKVIKQQRHTIYKLTKHGKASDRLLNLCIATNDDFFDTIGCGDEYSDWVRTR